MSFILIKVLEGEFEGEAIVNIDNIIVISPTPSGATVILKHHNCPLYSLMSVNEIWNLINQKEE